MLDFSSTEEILGKPAGGDLKGGLITAPTLFALQDSGELQGLVKSKFNKMNPESFEKGMNIIKASDALARTKKLADYHCMKAREAISHFPDCLEREALIECTHIVSSRTH